MHAAILALTIIGSTIGGLLLAALGIATIRALFDRAPAQVWTAADVPQYELRASQEKYPHKVLVALDIFLNVVVLGGRQCETISTHAFIATGEKKIWGICLNWWLNLIQPNHGYKAASGELERSSAEVARMRSLLKL